MSTVSDQRMKGQGNHGNGDYNSWSAQVNHGPGGVGHHKKSNDDYYRNHGAYHGHDSVKNVEQGMQGLGFGSSGSMHSNNHSSGGGGGGGNASVSKYYHQQQQQKEAPKKMTWATIASQPAKPQVNTTSTTVKKKGPGMPPPPMIPGKHNMDIGTWDSPSKNGPSAIVPTPPPIVPPPVLDGPSPLADPGPAPSSKASGGHRDSTGGPHGDRPSDRQSSHQSSSHHHNHHHQQQQQHHHHQQQQNMGPAGMQSSRWPTPGQAQIQQQQPVQQPNSERNNGGAASAGNGGGSAGPHHNHNQTHPRNHSSQYQPPQRDHHQGSGGGNYGNAHHQNHHQGASHHTNNYGHSRSHSNAAPYSSSGRSDGPAVSGSSERPTMNMNDRGSGGSSGYQQPPHHQYERAPFHHQRPSGGPPSNAHGDRAGDRERDRGGYQSGGERGGYSSDVPPTTAGGASSVTNASSVPPVKARSPSPSPSDSEMAAKLAESQIILDQLKTKNNYNPASLDLLKTAELARFFVIKSYSEDDIHRSIKYEIWCSTEHGNQRLDQAFREREEKGGMVYLFFSVNGSGHFCGVAQMMTAVDYNSNSSVWSQDKWKGTFKVRWIYVKDVPNSHLRHIRLENNENKSMTNSRDTQEVPNAKGIQVLQIIHSFEHQSSIFDDFQHYEKRQMEEDTRKHEAPPPSNHSYHNQRERREHQGGGGGGQYYDGPGKYHGGGGGGGYGGSKYNDRGGDDGYDGYGSRGGYHGGGGYNKGGSGSSYGGYNNRNNYNHHDGGRGYQSFDRRNNNSNNGSNNGDDHHDGGAPGSGGASGGGGGYQPRGGYNNSRSRDYYREERRGPNDYGRARGSDYDNGRDSDGGMYRGDRERGTSRDHYRN